MIITDLTTPEQPGEYNTILATFKYARKDQEVTLTTRQIMILTKHSISSNPNQQRLYDSVKQEAFGHRIKEKK